MISEQVETQVELECKACAAIANAANSPLLVYADELWVLRHSGSPYPAVGWMTLHARRHVANAAYFNDGEAADFGLIVRRISQALQEATGALRIYFASLSEATPHFHCHFVPRYEHGPKQWKAFDDLARARDGMIEVDAARVQEVIRTVAAALAAR